MPPVHGLAAKFRYSFVTKAVERCRFLMNIFEDAR